MTTRRATAIQGGGPTPAVPDDECRPRAEVAARQAARLDALLRALRGRNPFYDRKLHGASDAGDLAALPFTTKAELAADQAAAPPWGTARTEPIARYTRFHQTSSTTGRPLRWLDTPDSWRWVLDCWEAVYRAAGVTARDRILFPFSFGPFLGFWAGFDAAVRIGALAIPAGGMSSRQRLAAIAALAPTVVCCTPTYALRLIDAARADDVNGGRRGGGRIGGGSHGGSPGDVHDGRSGGGSPGDVHDGGSSGGENGGSGINDGDRGGASGGGNVLAGSAVRAVIVAGEPGGSIPATRARIERGWGAQVFDHHGLTEVGPVSFECGQSPGAPHVNEAEFIAEVVDPATGRPTPDGRQGELVLTTLGRIASPVLRYRTGDLVVRTRAPCACGRTFARLEGGILARVDDMVAVRGVNVYPAAVEAVLRGLDAVVEYRCTVRSDGAQRALAVEVELAAGADADAVTALAAARLRETLGLTVPVAQVDAGALPRFEMKARRFVVAATP